MEEASPFINYLGDMITHFPWGGVISIILFFLLGLIFLLVRLLLQTIWKKNPSEKNPPEIPKGAGVWTIRQQALWTRYYSSRKTKPHIH